MADIDQDFLREYLRVRPAHLALLRAQECGLYQDLELEQPTLDIGFGDGLFASLAFRDLELIGVDYSTRYIDQAIGSGVYRLLNLADCRQLPFPDECFGSVVSNSVLEHIEGIQTCLREISRVLKAGGYFAFTVPANDYTDHLLGTYLFATIKIPWLADLYARYMNSISRHINYFAPDEWVEYLKVNDLNVTRKRSYFSTHLVRLFDALHPLGYPAFISKRLFGRWVVFPNKIDFKPFANLATKISDSNESVNGAYIFLVCKKVVA